VTLERRIKVIVPIAMDAAGVANRALQLPADLVAPGFKPEFAAVKWGAALGDSYHDMLLMDWTVFQAGIDAEDTLGKRFTILTMWEEWFPLYHKILTDYGWWDRLASMRSIDTRPDVTELLAGKEEVIFEKLRAVAELAIAEDGADVIVLCSTTMHQSAAYLAGVLPVPVINPGQVAYKHLETLITLGLSHSKAAFPAPEVGKDDDIRKGWA